MQTKVAAIPDPAYFDFHRMLRFMSAAALDTGRFIEAAGSHRLARGRRVLRFDLCADPRVYAILCPSN